MHEGITELLLHGLLLFGYGAVATIMAAAGLLFEYRSYVFLSGGNTMQAAWLGGMGVVLLFFASSVVRDKFATTYRDLKEEVQS